MADRQLGLALKAAARGDFRLIALKNLALRQKM
jgi:hypothetical protein